MEYIATCIEELDHELIGVGKRVEGGINQREECRKKKHDIYYIGPIVGVHGRIEEIIVNEHGR